jgi:hypothetical protein
MKRLTNLRKVAPGVWTDGKELFYFPTIDSDDNLEVASIIISGLTASRLIATDGDKKLTSVANTATVQFGLVYENGTYAEIYVADSSATQSIATGSTYVKCTLFTTNGLSNNCTADVSNDKITITKAGIYSVSGSFHFISGTANVVWNGAAFLDGVEQSQVHWKRKASTATDDGSTSFTGFVDVTSVPVDLDFRLRHDNGGSVDFELSYGNLNVQYVGDT